MLAYFGGPAADLAFRRGWTHGILALALWPFVLTGGMVLLDRVLHQVRRAGHPSSLVPKQLLLLATIAILSHPILDTANTYGMRWLMPFSGRWFYGDTLFIIDPWLWLALGAGLLSSRRRQGSTGPPRIALTISAAYAAAMAISAIVARRLAGPELEAISGAPVQRLMVSPFPVNPFLRSVVAEQEGVYRTARFRWLPRPHIDRSTVRESAKGDRNHPAVQQALATTAGRRYLGWARFPAFRVEHQGGERYLVRIIDLRYGDPPGAPIGSIEIPVDAATLSP